MNEFKTCFRKYAEFSGRARRREYWMFFLMNSLIGVGLLLLEAVFTACGLPAITLLLSGAAIIYSIAVLIPGVAVTVRRLHDVGKGGVWYLINFVPLIGGIWFLILLLSDSQPGPNMYGENPKGVPNPYLPGGRDPININIINGGNAGGTSVHVSNDNNGETNTVVPEDGPTQRTGNIKILTGQYKGAVLPIRNGEEILLGRDSTKCHLVFADDRVSRVHCSVTYDCGTNSYRVTDYSSYGTFVKDGRQLEKNKAEVFRGGTVFVLGKSGEEFSIR